MKSSLYRSALAGAVCWIIAALGLHPSPLHLRWGILLLLLAPLVLAPLAMSLRDLVTGDRIGERLQRVAAWLQFPAAILLSLSFALPEGTRAGILATPWLGITALISATGALEIYRRRPALEDLCISAEDVIS
jgi:hypothetical protein